MPLPGHLHRLAAVSAGLGAQACLHDVKFRRNKKSLNEGAVPSLLRCPGLVKGTVLAARWMSMILQLRSRTGHSHNREKLQAATREEGNNSQGKLSERSAETAEPMGRRCVFRGERI